MPTAGAKVTKEAKTLVGYWGQKEMWKELTGMTFTARVRQDRERRGSLDYRVDISCIPPSM